MEEKNNSVESKEEIQPQKVEIVKEKGAWSTGKLVIGIISMVLFIIIAFQSCAAGIGNALEENNSTSGTSGLLCALLMLIGGIVTVATRNKKTDGGSIASIIIYFMGASIALLDTATFGDLAFWGTLSLSFGLVNLGCILAKKGKIKDSIIVCGIIAISIIMLILSLSSDENESSPTTPSVNNSSQEQTIQKTEYNKNETVMYRGLKFSVTNVKYSNGNDWDSPAAGKVFVIVTIKIENNSDKKISYNVYDWKIRNSEGQEDEESFTTIDNDTNLGSGTLAIGGKKEGTIVFEEPKNDKSLKLLYFDNSLFDEEEAFSIIIK